ncbi:hypothetical protein RPPS3_21560 [Rhodopseudomonas palustris]|uniref:hypothetical protein n=2 Tax=Rhodopseudomonas TaxID=1073 RepID=UPI000D220EFE|nr:hypothetical protein [Rhodopseudomonas palustris]AVT76219.1 hypothetical protein RPPS3_21560 [Rhodopseudomonas palustris]
MTKLPPWIARTMHVVARTGLGGFGLPNMLRSHAELMMMNFDPEHESKQMETSEAAGAQSEPSGVAMRVWARHRLRELAESGRLGMGSERARRRG